MQTLANAWTAVSIGCPAHASPLLRRLALPLSFELSSTCSTFCFVWNFLGNSKSCILKYIYLPRFILDKFGIFDSLAVFIHVGKSLTSELETKREVVLSFYRRGEKEIEPRSFDAEHKLPINRTAAPSMSFSTFNFCGGSQDPAWTAR